MRRRSPLRSFRPSVQSLESRLFLAFGVANIDSFEAMPLSNETQEFSFYNNVGGDRGEVKPENGGEVFWHDGWIRAEITQDHAFAGIFQSVDGPIIQATTGLDFNALLGSYVAESFQATAESLLLNFANGTGPITVKLEGPAKETVWEHTFPLSGGVVDVRIDFPDPVPGNVQAIVITIDGTAGNFFELNEIGLRYEAADVGNQEPAVWSAATLLELYDEELKIAGDRKNFGTEDFANVPVTLGTALAVVELERLGVVSMSDAIDLVNEITDTALSLPRFKGLLPHFVVVDDSGQTPRYSIKPDTEWSSVDTSIGLLSLILARESLGLETDFLEQMVREIDWEDLTLTNGTISHGYQFNGDRIPEPGWDVFGSESLIILWAYAAARPNLPLPSLVFEAAPTWNGAAFLDEMAALFFDVSGVDAFGNDWERYRTEAASDQRDYYRFVNTPLFGLSPAEVAEPWTIDAEDVYQEFGIGGHNGSPNDGSSLTGLSHVAPHAIGLLSGFHSSDAIAAWEHLKQHGFLSPITTVESIAFDAANPTDTLVANPLKSGWNHFLQTMGYTRALAGDNYAAYEAAMSNAFVATGFAKVFPDFDDGEYQNPNSPTDVSGNGETTLSDALNVVAFLRRNGSSVHLPTTLPNFTPPPFYDVDGNNFATIADALLIIAELRRQQDTKLPVGESASDAEPFLPLTLETALTDELHAAEYDLALLELNGEHD